MKWMLMLMLLPVAGGVGTSADWPQFRGPHGNAVANETRLPSKLDDTSIAWSVSLPGRGLSSPIIIGNRIFVTAASGPKQDRLHVLCFSADTGALRWERQFWATGRTMAHEKTSVAAPTPASNGRHVFAIFSSNDIVALDFDGNVMWLRGLGQDYPNASNSLGMTSSLVTADGVVIAQVESDSESFTAGLDARTGVNRWKLDRPKMANWTSPSLVRNAKGKALAMLQSGRGIVAVEPATGRRVWEYNEGAATIPSATVSGGRAYVPSNGLTVLDVWSDGPSPRQLWRAAQLRPGTSSPVVFGDRVYLLNDGGVLTCAAAADGSRLWQLRLKGAFSATPVAAGHHLYCVSEKGLLQVLDLTPAEGAVVGELDLGQTVLSTPSIAYGGLFVRSDAKLWKMIERKPAL